MQVLDTAIPDLKLIVPRKFEDERGFFSETWNRRDFADAGIPHDFVQDSHAMSVAQGTIRGLHFQLPPHAQDKLVRVVRGSILDVAVDLRRSSSTFGRHVAVKIGADEWNQLFVPVGFAHGYCTLAPNTEVIYKVTSHYAPDHEGGVLWNDPALGIDWPVSADQAAITERDRQLPPLAELTVPFT